MAVPGGCASVIVLNSLPLVKSHMVIWKVQNLHYKILTMANFHFHKICFQLFLIRNASLHWHNKMSSITNWNVILTCPFANPVRSRVQSLLKLSADTAPYCAPTAVDPKHHFITCFGSENTQGRVIDDHKILRTGKISRQFLKLF